MTELNISHADEFKKCTVLAVITLVAIPLLGLLVACIMKLDVKSGGEMDMLFYILLIVAAVEPAVAPLVERFHLKKFRSAGSSRMSSGQLLTSISLIKFALVEAIYIYGLVVYVIVGDIVKMLPFYLVGAIWSVVYWPRRSTWEKSTRANGVK